MKKLSSYLKQHKTTLCFALILFCAALLLNLLARNVSGFGPWYAQNVYPLLPNTLGRLLSFLPFSLFEVLVVLALLAGGVLLLSALVLLPCLPLSRLTIRRSCHQAVSALIRMIKKLWGRSLPIIICILALMFFLQTLTCFINYNRMDFTAEAGLATYPATSDDLKQLCSLLIGKLDELVQDKSLRFDGDGCLSLENIDVKKEAKAAMVSLGKKYPSLSGCYPNPKAIFFSKAMSTLNLTGIFSPYTTEANYNRDVRPYVIPYTICHELAHVKGHIKENEAGFIAYLACSQSDSPQLRYSGTLNALSYSLNALYRSVPEEEYIRVLRTVPKQALNDLIQNQEYWKRFQTGVKGAISSAAHSANDHYLKANAQQDGAKSYGRMVDLLLAYYKIGASEV